MHEKLLSTDVCELLDSSIESVEQLDALVALHRDPSRWFALEELASSIGVSAQAARVAMDALRNRGLASEVAAGAMYRLAPLEPLAHAAFNELARAYASERAAIVAHVSRGALDRIRLLAQAFTSGRRL